MSALSMPEELSSLAIDFDEFKKIADEANDGGFDPYTYYMKMRAKQE